MPIGMTGPYPGGSYEGKGGIKGTDYNDDGTGAQYRDPSVQVSVDKPNEDGLKRGAFDVQTNWVVVSNTQGDWYNYTRDFPMPAKTYNVYARLASGGLPMNASLDLVTSFPDLPDQTLTNLGTFSASATGSWDVYSFVPLRNAQGSVAAVELPGAQSPTTLRFTVLPGDLDFNYLVFIPAARTTIKKNADGSLVIAWTNGGTLESADKVEGPYTTTGNSTGSATLTKAELVSRKFYRVK
ncbi:MAG TPA: hypothetical protein VEO53_05450, partial [Candidatus Binatia bacterium]|nr:hypothetical protein [Candidatus Binatia bacterium]